jgi:hypothetical protein
MTEKILNDNEWRAAMDFVLASEDKPAEPEPVEDKAGKKKMPAAFLKELMKKKGIKPAADLLTEIPSGGGWVGRTGTPQPTSNKVSNEIPDDGPTVPSGGETPPSTEDVDKWATRVGKPQPTGTPKVSMASAGVNYGDDTSGAWSSVSADTGTKTGVNLGEDTSAGWSTGVPKPTTKSLPAKAAGTPDPNQSPDGPTKVDTLNRAPRGSMAKMNADEDLDDDVPDNLSLPDGSFFVANKGDLQSAIGKVKNADQTNPRPQKPIYTEVKKHLVRRAKALKCPEMIPNDWQMMMAMHEQDEIAKLISALGAVDSGK